MERQVRKLRSTNSDVTIILYIGFRLMVADRYLDIAYDLNPTRPLVAIPFVRGTI